MEEMKNMILWLMLLLAHITAIYGQTRSCSVEGDVQVYQTASFGSIDNAGRVEICMGGVWGTIAADSVATPWSEKNAQVACIQADFSGVLNVILQRTIPIDERSGPSVLAPIHLSGVQCNGSEISILNCSSSSVVPSSVNHLQDAYVVCRPRSRSYSDVHPAGVQSGDIRLFGDTRNGYGAVEIYSFTNGWWGICPDSSWTDSDAATICQDLGYASGTVIPPITVISSSTTRVPPVGLYYAASCPPRAGDPRTLGVCSFQFEPLSSGCNPNEFAALRCSNVTEMSVRLLGGDDSQEGIVEIAYNGRWGMLCDNRFTTTDAESICEGLGFNQDDASMMSLSSTSRILDSESNLKPIWLTELGCSSSDSSLVSCIREENIIGFANCRSSGIVAVDCGYPAELTTASVGTSDSPSIMLFVIAFIGVINLIICHL